MTVYFDHNPLTYIKDCAPKSAKLSRWSLALQEFEILSISLNQVAKNLEEPMNYRTSSLLVGASVTAYSSSEIQRMAFHRRWKLVP